MLFEAFRPDESRLNEPERLAAPFAADETQARLRGFALADAISQLERMATDIVSGGEAYPAEIRNAARQLMPELAGARFKIVASLRRAPTAPCETV